MVNFNHKLFSKLHHCGIRNKIGVARGGLVFNKLRHAMGAAMGSARSEGALQLVQTKEHLWHEWNKGCGMFGWGMTHGAVTKFVAQYGIDLSQTGIDPKTKLSKADLEKLFDEFAKVLLENGAVSFSKR